MKNSKDFLTLKLSEEASEVAQAGLKLALYGPSSGQYNNLENLVGELKDLLATVSLLSADYPALQMAFSISAKDLEKATRHYKDYEAATH